VKQKYELSEFAGELADKQAQEAIRQVKDDKCAKEYCIGQCRKCEYKKDGACSQ
jgi:hypothetical protein